MPLAACPRCKKMFDKGRSKVCSKCQADEDEDFDKIRTALELNPNMNAEQTAVEADVTVACVMRMQETGMITNVSFSESAKCGKCGAPAISINKKLCQACLEKLNAEVALAQSKIKLKEKKEVQVSEFLHARKAFEEKRR